MSDGKYILIVDDDPDLVEAVAVKLESGAYQVGKAYDGIEAWQSIKEQRPDLVILDVMMPRKNGYQVCQEMKEDQQYAGIPVILLTAVGSAVPSTGYTHRDGMNVEAEEYLAKPVDLDQLLEVVSELT